MMMTRWARQIAKGATLAAMSWLAACAQQPVERTAESNAPPTYAQPAAATARVLHPVSDLEVIPLTVHTDSGSHEFAVELAVTGEEQAQGLMHRYSMGADEGMLFPNDPPQMRSFWMKNTVIPLDIIFVGPDRRIINIAADTVPYSEDSVASAAPAIAVLELNGGRSAELGIEPGDLVEW